MPDVAKLKKKAADFELKKQFEKALATYVEILDYYSKRPNEEVDLALYNRVGDLYLKQGNVADAVDYYEQAVDRYSEGGFFNNAIALCNKILRNSPGRASVYYKLGKISALKGFKGDAKANFLEYADRMSRSGQIDESFRALKEFADLCPDQDDIRLMLADQLSKKGRAPEAIQQLQTLYQRYTEEGRNTEARATLERIKSIDPSSGAGRTAAPEEAAPAARSAPRSAGDLVFLDLDDHVPTPPQSAPAQRPAAPSRPPEPPPAQRAQAQVEQEESARARRATAGLDLISPELTVAPVAPRPASRAPTPPIAAEPVEMDFAPEPEFEQEPELVPEREQEPSALDGEQMVELEMYDAGPAGTLDVIVDADLAGDAGGGLLAGLETTSFGPPAAPESGGLLDFEPTSFAEAPPTRAPRPPRPAPPASIADDLLDFEMPDQRTSGPREVAPREVLRSPSPPARPAAPARPSLTDLPMLADDASGVEEEAMGGDLQLIMPDDDVADASAPAGPLDHIPLMDLDLPRPGEATAGITGSPVSRASAPTELDLVDLASAAFELAPEPVAEVTPAELDVRAELDMDTAPLAREHTGDFATIDTTPPALSGSYEAVPDTREESGDFEAVPAPARRSSTMLAAQSVELLQALVDADPDDQGLRRRLGEAMLESGDREGGLRELEAAMVGYERNDDLSAAASLADEIVLLNPGSVRHHQKRVEYAFRTNERGRLIEAYLQLADALFRAEQVEKSRAIYQRVLDLSPDDLRANAALQSFPEPEPAPVVAPPAPKGRASVAMPRASAPHAAAPVAPPRPMTTDDDSFVNLGDWLRDDAAPKDTRMVVEEQEPTGDEEADFQDMLRKFKQGIAENVDEEDHQSHYDLGVAYKEMGLLDEAIAEFQKALRGPANRVSTYEALGQCFIEKEQYPMAATILSRALAEKGVTDDQLVGVLYLLGVCAEQRGQLAQAADFYQRVFVVDIQFRDVGDRLAAVEGAL